MCGLLEAQIRPFNIHPVRQNLLRHPVQLRHRLRGRENARIGIANQIRRRITVVANYRVRPVGGADIHHTADRHHFALIIAGAQISNIFHAVAERPVGLCHHAPGTPKLVKIVHIRRSQIGLQRTEKVGQRHALRFRLIAIDLHVQLRHVSLVSRDREMHPRGLHNRTGHRIHRVLQRTVAQTGAILDVQRIARTLTQP
ncbi:hypothetical protein D3C80_1327320 [compost metagenome]